MNIASWATRAEDEMDRVVALRRAIHQDPELGLHCTRTTEKILMALDGLPLEIRRGPSSSGVVAILRCEGSDDRRSVLLRGDTDALPVREETGLAFASACEGVMHACGHDAHTAMLVGAAHLLCARREIIGGTIAFMFQPGEEGQHGARHMLEDGLLDDVLAGRRPDAAFAIHIWPTIRHGAIASRAGALLASADRLQAVIQGRGGHAAMPHDSLDPIPVACEIVMAIQSHIARTVPVTDPAVLSITQIKAGTTHNIVPASVELVGTLRTLSDHRRDAVKEAFGRIVEHVAAAHGMAGVASIDPGYPVTVNDERAVRLVRDCALALGGEQAWVELPATNMGAEDFSYVLREIPGAMAFLGVAAEGSDAASNPPLHNSRMVIDEATMARGVALHCAFAERFLASGFD